MGRGLPSPDGGHRGALPVGEGQQPQDALQARRRRAQRQVPSQRDLPRADAAVRRERHDGNHRRQQPTFPKTFFISYLLIILGFFFNLQ